MEYYSPIRQFDINTHNMSESKYIYIVKEAT
jgi:hypothetical protein